jgi:hypothetical protein
VDVGDGVLVGVPAPKAQIETSHEGDLTVNQTQFLVVCPEKNHIVSNPVQPLDLLIRKRGEFGGIHRQVP